MTPDIVVGIGVQKRRDEIPAEPEVRPIRPACPLRLEPAGWCRVVVVTAVTRLEKEVADDCPGCRDVVAVEQIDKRSPAVSGRCESLLWGVG